jgi:hypothetical protein
LSVGRHFDLDTDVVRNKLIDDIAALMVAVVQAP